MIAVQVSIASLYQGEAVFNGCKLLLLSPPPTPSLPARASEAGA